MPYGYNGSQRTNIGTGLAVAALQVGIAAALVSTFTGGIIGKIIPDAIKAITVTPQTPPSPNPEVKTPDQPIPHPENSQIFSPDPPFDLPNDFGPIMDTTSTLPPTGSIDLLPRDPYILPTKIAAFTPRRALPLGDPGLWIGRGDYPTRAIREDWSGVTGFRLDIGSEGRVTNCAITASSGHEELDAVACDKLTSRARFNPASDDEGRKTAGSYVGKIRWALEN